MSTVRQTTLDDRLIIQKAWTHKGELLVERADDGQLVAVAVFVDSLKRKHRRTKGVAPVELEKGQTKGYTEWGEDSLRRW